MTQLSLSQTATQPVTQELRDWIASNVQTGCEPKTLFDSMRATGWQAAVALQALQETLPEHLHESLKTLGQACAEQPAADLPPPVAVPEPVTMEGPYLLGAVDREVQVLSQMLLPRVVVFGGLLSHAECDELMALAGTRLSRSETVQADTGGNEVHEARTSDGMFFGREENPMVARIEARIAALLQWPLINGEGLQVLRYKPGAQYKPHYDYFDPAFAGTTNILKRGGQRVASLVMYLNTPLRGGATTFPDVGFEVAPIKGNAVFFSYDRAHPASKTLHGGAPVLEGEKWVATKWLREGRFD
jgi:prolyl 4-hydroxylase